MEGMKSSSLPPMLRLKTVKEKPRAHTDLSDCPSSPPPSLGIPPFHNTTITFDADELEMLSKTLAPAARISALAIPLTRLDAAKFARAHLQKREIAAAHSGRRSPVACRPPDEDLLSPRDGFGPDPTDLGGDPTMRGRELGRFSDVDSEQPGRLKQLIMSEVVRQRGVPGQALEISEMPGKIVRDEGSRAWVRSEGPKRPRERMLVGFGAEFRPAPPEVRAKMDASKGAAALRKYLVRHGLKPPDFLGHAGELNRRGSRADSDDDG
jgi:hypothetical protein